MTHLTFNSPNTESQPLNRVFTGPAEAKRGKNREAALDLAREGFKVFPAKPNKRPYVKDWANKATDDAERIKRWWKRWPDAVPALPTGAANGLAVLDLDRHGETDGTKSLEEIPVEVPDPMLVIGTPSGGVHQYYHHVEGVRNSAGKIAPGVDVRGEGGYVIAPGGVTKGGEYKIEDGDWDVFRMVDIPFPAKILPAGPKATGGAQPAAGGCDPAELWDALRFVSSDGGRDPWVEILMALHHATLGSEAGRALAHAWSARDYAQYKRADVDKIWQSFGKTDGARITAETLFARAREGGWSRPVDDSVLEDLDDESGEAVEAQDGGERLIFMTPGECTPQKGEAYVVKGLIGPGQVGCIFGDPGAGKSLLAPHIAYAVAQGRKAFGLRTRSSPVFYVAAEDESGMRGRIRALAELHGDAEDFKLVGGVSDLLVKNSADLKALIAAVKRDRPGLIVVDTLAMAFPGLEENSAEGMGRVVAVSRALARRGAAVLLIHHGTKADGATPRGHGLLNGAIDMAMRLLGKDEGGIIRGRLTKNRNGSCDLDLAFGIDVQEFGIDADGDAITAARASELPPGCAATGPKLTPTERAVVEVFDRLAGGDAVVERAALRDAAMRDINITSSENQSTRKATVNRALRGLAEKGVFEADGEVVRKMSDRPDLSDRLEDLEPI